MQRLLYLPVLLIIFLFISNDTIHGQEKSSASGFNFTSCDATIEFLNGNDEVLEFLEIGHFGEDGGQGLTGYTDGPNHNVKNGNGPADNFIDLDGDRFYVKVDYPEGNVNPTAIDVIEIKIGSGVDDLTVNEAYETGENTGIFKTRSQLLTAVGLDQLENYNWGPPQAISDDDFKANDGQGSLIDDDKKNDRTHNVTITGQVKVEMNTGATKTLDVCGAAKRKKVKLSYIQFVEPSYSTGGGIDYNLDELFGESYFYKREKKEIDEYMGESIQLADALWAQACIAVEPVHMLQLVGPPAYFADNEIDNDDLVNILHGLEVLTQTNPSEVIVANVAKMLLFDDMEADQGYRPVAITFSPGSISGVIPAEHVIIIYESGEHITEIFTLAHELGHALAPSIEDVQDSPKYLYFPQNLFDDQFSWTPNFARRITKSVENEARQNTTLLHGM
ncbi:MAG: hypothetical protein AAFZ15_32465 [Bacteroidota bacterium]